VFVRVIEIELSSKYRVTVLVLLVEGIEVGDIVIIIIGAGTYKYKILVLIVVNALYLDDVSDWNDIASGDNITPTASHDTIAVCRVDTNGLVLGYGSATITKRTS